jgi:membrane-associated phospholipid phosphatase
MNRTQGFSKLIVVCLTIGLLICSYSTSAKQPNSNAQTIWGSRYNATGKRLLPQAHPFRPGNSASERLRHWNEIAVDASGLDHTRPEPGETRLFGQQLGPGRSARAIAIVHIAIFEALNAIDGKYESYIGLPAADKQASMECAIAQAAHDTLCEMFSSQIPTFDQLLTEELNDIPDSESKTKGIQVGHAAAAAILALRSGDGSAHAEPLVGLEWITSNDAGRWRQDPISLIPIALGAHWGEVTPFVLTSASQFRTPAPPALSSPEYTEAYNEAKAFGGDGIITPTIRTDEQTIIGLFWAYDGTPSLCAPPRLYNQITMRIADIRNTHNVVDLARLLALVNVSMADAGIAIWESKFYYDFWRPVTAIRESDPGTGLTGTGDGNDSTIGDLTFSPLGAPASNLNGPNFTPPFPSYPSGHAGFGGALFQTLRRFYGKDKIPFAFVSDEFNGVTQDNNDNPRPLIERSFSSLSQAEEENGQSRIYLGIHWRFDKTEGIAQGNRVADYVFDHVFKKKHGTGK